MAKFKPGISGNPNGRPKDKTPATLIRAAIERRKDDILQSVINAAVFGDMQAAKILLDRICPPLKPYAQPVTLPIDGDNTLTGQAAKVVSATLAGTIPPDIGAQLITALANQAKIVEIDDLTKRISKLEEQTNEQRDK